VKKILLFLKHHLRADFNTAHYVFVLSFLSICMYFNYRWNFYNDFLNEQTGITKFIYCFLFYGIGYFVPVISFSFFSKQFGHFKIAGFWIKSLLVVSLLALDNTLAFYWEWVEAIVVHPLRFWLFKMLNYLMSFITIIAPLLLFHHFYEKEERNYYGLNSNKFDIKPYLLLLVIVMPVIITAAFHGSFLNQYPMYKSSGANGYLCTPEWFTVLLFELSYAFDFISVEFVFRGFLVIGMIAIMGRSSVLTMASVYCFLHFGKPPGEAMSSIIGGYILGVIAYETKSIWGGIIIHIGVAMTMEFAAFMQR
jgi:hypothetical protein